MAEHGNVHGYVNWAKQRIDEMGVVLASLETKASQIIGESKIKVDQVIGDMKKRRDEFQAIVEEQADAGEDAWQRAKTQLDSRWSAFEAQVKAYFETTGQQAEQEQATFGDIAAAQAKAWREAADRFHGEAAKVMAARRADVDAAVKQMKVDAADAEARLQTLRQAGTESWAALSAALAESRKAFDRANQAVVDALKRAAP